MPCGHITSVYLEYGCILYYELILKTYIFWPSSPKLWHTEMRILMYCLFFSSVLLNINDREFTVLFYAVCCTRCTAEWITCFTREYFSQSHSVAFTILVVPLEKKKGSRGRHRQDMQYWMTCFCYLGSWSDTKNRLPANY